MKHDAICSCGQLKVSYDGEIIKTTICHCLACQRRTGSVFGVQTRLEKAKCQIQGESKVYKRTGDDRNVIEFHFCPTCGATVYYEAPWMPGSIAVPVGAFADPTLPMPTMQVYGNRKHHWITLPEEIKEFFG